MGTYKNFRLHSSGISWPTAIQWIRFQADVADASRCHPEVSRPSHAVSGHHAARTDITNPLHCFFPIRCVDESLVVTARCLVQRYRHQKCSKVKEVTYITNVVLDLLRHCGGISHQQKERKKNVKNKRLAVGYLFKAAERWDYDCMSNSE